MAALRGRDKDLLTDEREVGDKELHVFYLYYFQYLIEFILGLITLTDTAKKSVTVYKVSFRFRKTEIEHTATALRLRFTCKNGTVAGRLEGLYILLRRLAYPSRLSHMIQMFGRLL